MAKANKRPDATKASRDAFERACLAMPKAKRAKWASGREIKDRISFRIDDSDYREFAAWFPKGNQIGGHLRYGDAKRLDDPRFERSTAFRGAKHNWLYVKAASAEWKALRDLIEESYRAAGQRGGGLAISGTEVYAPLKRGLALATDAQRPTRLHAAGPAAKIVSNEGPAAFKLALWSARTIRDLVPATEAAELDRAFTALDAADALRDQLVADLPDREIRMGKGYDKLSKTSDKLPAIKGTSLPILAARAAIGAFHCLPGGYNERAISYAGDAVEATVRALQAMDRDVAAYLAEFDKRTLIAEVQAVAKAHTLALPALTHVMWRGADDKGYPAYWLFALATGELGLVCKLGRRWQLTTGARDHVLATIPDTHFAAAVDYIATAI